MERPIACAAGAGGDRTESGFIPASVSRDKICLQQAMFGEGIARPFTHDEVVEEPYFNE